jgi:hypothetical protein
MKKTVLLMSLLLLAMAVQAQQTDSSPAASAAEQSPQGTFPTSVSFPVERVQTPTHTDIYCAGFLSKQSMPNANFVMGGLHTANTTKFVEGDMIYLGGSGYQSGQEYTILRAVQDPNRYELFTGQHALIKATGQPYAELGRVKIIDTRNKTAVAQVEFSCDTVVPGDIAVPFAEKPMVSFHPPVRFDRFAPANDKVSGRIVMAKDFDSEVGTGMKVYMNVGAGQGIKVGDYFRAVRSYEADLKDPVDSLSFKASTTEDTQKDPPSVEPKFMSHTKGQVIHVADLPRRAVGEIVVINTTDTTATGMIVFALEDVHVGDGVELDEQQ